MSDYEPSDDELDRAERIITLLDNAYTAAMPPHGEDDWADYMKAIAEAVTDLAEAHHVISMLLLSDAYDLIAANSSPSASWAHFYEAWGHRR